jgi:hypothetical protein
MDPIRPKLTQAFAVLLQLLYVISVQNNNIASSLEDGLRAGIASKGQKSANSGQCCKRIIIQPDKFNTVKYALTTMRHFIRLRRISHTV